MSIALPSSPASGVVFDIQRAAIYDGPGLRTVVFLKGCPLRCSWCHNPESQAAEPETGKSGKCYGRRMTVAEVMEQVRADIGFYETSGGGLTISGGEPTVQFEFCRALLKAARSEGIHTCLDTSGVVLRERLAQLAPSVSLFLYDYKATGSDLHRKLTGIGSLIPHENLRFLLSKGASVRLRCPLVPGVNDSAEHLAAIGSLMREFPTMEADIMPYHATGNLKCADLGMRQPELRTQPPEAEDFGRWRDGIRAASGQRLPHISGIAT